MGDDLAVGRTRLQECVRRVSVLQVAPDCRQLRRNLKAFVRLSRQPYTCHVNNTLHTYIDPFNGPLSGTTWVGRYQKGKTNLDFTEARDSEWQWQQLAHMQVCISLQTDNHASTPPLSFLQAGCPSSCPTNSIKALNKLSH